MTFPSGFFSTFFFLLAAPRFISAMEGRLFYINFLELESGMLDGMQNKIIQEIFIIGNRMTNVRFVQYNNSLAYTVTNITLDSSNRFFYKKQYDYEITVPVGKQLPVAIYIAADQDISVMANKGGYGSTDGYLALPLTTTSTSFFLASYSNFIKVPSSFSIASISSSACVDIRYYNGPISYRMQRLTLKANEVFTSESFENDYTGVSITSTKPIAVLSGHACAQVTVGLAFCDHLVEQVPPINEWGQDFIASSFIGNAGRVDRSYIIRVIAGLRTTTSCNISQVNKMGTVASPTSFNIEIGNFYEYQVSNPTLNNIAVVIKCNQKVLVMQYGMGNYKVSNHSSIDQKPDPFMVTVPPLDHYTNNQGFHTSKFISKSAVYDFQNYITYIFNSSYKDDIIFTDSVGLNSQEVMSIPSSVFGSSYTIISRPVAAGLHKFLETNKANPVSYAVFVYGYAYSVAGDETSPTGYGYLAGYKYTTMPSNMIKEGNWFTDNNLPASPSINNTNPIVINSNISKEELPAMTALWRARFCTIKFDEFLISKQCSEGYEKYFSNVRLKYMNEKILNACEDISAMIQMSPFQFNEYTCGNIYITSTIKKEKSTD